MQKAFIKLAEYGDKLSSHPIFLLLFNAALVALWLTFGTDIANIFISIITAEMVLLGAGAARRGFLAIHVKLDTIIRALKDASNDFIHIEAQTEQEIIEKRKELDGEL